MNKYNLQKKHISPVFAKLEDQQYLLRLEDKKDLLQPLALHMLSKKEREKLQ
jgi:hypothetical protein